jgi:hypothetical protein
MFDGALATNPGFRPAALSIATPSSRPGMGASAFALSDDVVVLAK